jgi:Ca-activated chloride channel family protein
MRPPRAAGFTAALAALVLAAPAPAQPAPDRAQPVVGGGSFNAAPLLEPGTYRDTVLTGEYLYYAIALEAGQRLHVRARILDMDAETWDRATAAFSINLHTPQREPVSSPVDEDVAGNRNTDRGSVTDANIDERLRWDFFGPRAQPFAAASDGTDYQGPGTWYVSLHPVRVGQRAKVELPVELSLDVDGAAVEEEPDPTPEPSPTPAAEPASEEDGGGPSPLAALGAGALGLAVGLGAGTALGRRR